MLHTLTNRAATRGLSLIEIAFAAALLALVAVGYLGALSTGVGVGLTTLDRTQAGTLAQMELELLRTTAFEQVPYVQTSEAKDLEQVPDYLTNLVLDSVSAQGVGELRSTGTNPNYDIQAIGDGIRMDETRTKWVGSENGPLNVPGGAWPGELDNPSDGIIVGGGSTPNGVVVVDPGSDGDSPVTPESQLAYVTFNERTSIHRIIYDNRYNTSGDPSLAMSTDPPVIADAIAQTPGVYQKAYRIFVSNADLRSGNQLNPDVDDVEIVARKEFQTIRDAGVHVEFDNVAEPIDTQVLGVGDILTLSASDPTFHYPYVGEIEAYGFASATAYIPTYAQADGRVEAGNYVMFFPNYRGSDFDLARRVYLDASYGVWPPADKPVLLQVEIEVMSHEPARNTKTFMEQDWWQNDNTELVKVTSSIYRDKQVTGGVLPTLPDTLEMPFNHTNYRSGEDFMHIATVPGADSIRVHFDVFDLERIAGTDFVQFYDVAGNQYGLDEYYGNATDPTGLAGQFSPWVPGDTLVIRFRSNDKGSSLAPRNYGGVRADFAEINGVAAQIAVDADSASDEVKELFKTDVYPKIPPELVPADQLPPEDFFVNPSATDPDGGSGSATGSQQMQGAEALPPGRPNTGDEDLDDFLTAGGEVTPSG